MTTTLVKEALSKSTFHGIPRAVNSPSVYMRVFWMILVCGGISIFGYHVSMLAQKYWNENIVTSSDLRGLKFVFPHIYLCHKVPVSLSYYKMKFYAKDKSFITLNSNLEKANLLQKNVEKDANSTSRLTSSHFFWETQPLENFIDTVGHQSYQTVTMLNIQDKEVSVDDNRVSLKFIRNHKYCFRIVATSEEMGYTSEEVRMVVYSDRDEDPDYTEFLKKIDQNDELSFGLRVYFTQPDTLPNFETQLVHIRPGYFYDIRLKMLSYNLYNTSTRSCFKDNTFFVDKLNATSNDYTLDDLYQSCYDKKIQQLLVKECGCYDNALTMAVITPEVYGNYPTCFNVSKYSNANEYDPVLLKRYKCYIEFNTKSSKDQFYSECRQSIPCNTHTYTPYWSFMKWPSENSIDNTVLTYINAPAADRHKRNLSVPGWHHIMNIATPIEKEKEVRSTFSEIKIRPQEFFSTVMTEIEQYPIINFWSDIGGILGLYLGVSILTFFESVELLHNLVGTFLFARKEKQREVTHKGDKGTSAVPNGGHSSTSLWI